MKQVSYKTLHVYASALLNYCYKMVLLGHKAHVNFIPYKLILYE